MMLHGNYDIVLLLLIPFWEYSYFRDAVLSKQSVFESGGCVTAARLPDSQTKSKLQLFVFISYSSSISKPGAYITHNAA